MRRLQGVLHAHRQADAPHGRPPSARQVRRRGDGHAFGRGTNRRDLPGVANMNRDDVARTHLPIADIQHSGLITYDAKDPDTKFPPIRDVRPPKGAPNVLVILIDDVGYGATSAFGGPCQTPNFEKLAKGGLSYTRFHTTALCSPTRQALLTGRNHHSVGTGVIIEMGTGYPGYTGIIPKSTATVAETLRDNGYATAMFGKAHNTP